MAELVDALDSKSCYRKVVQVRFLFWAPNKNPHHNNYDGDFYIFQGSDYSEIPRKVTGLVKPPLKNKVADLVKFPFELPLNPKVIEVDSPGAIT